MALGALLLASCDKKPIRPEAGANSPDWSLGNPGVTIGVAEGEEPYELAGASASIRLPDGRIVIANSGTSQLRIFDSTGTFIESIGRKGEGPGEFTGSMQIVSLSDSEFAVFDQSAQRLSIFDTSGTLARESRTMAEAGSDFPLWVWLYRDAWVTGPADTSQRAAVRGILGKLAELPPGSYRYVHVATDGRVWSQQRIPGAAPLPWEIHSSTGALVGRIVLPAGTEIHQIGHDFVLLRDWGENDVERIQLYPFSETRGRTEADVRPPRSQDAAPDSSARTRVTAAMRDLVMAQEMFYVDSGAYARTASGLNWKGPPGTSLHLMAADKRGWVGVVVLQGQAFLCGMAVGGSTPPGWPEGSPKCSE